MTGTEIIAEVRTALVDTTSGAYRFADATLLQWLNDGIAVVFNRRRDAVLLEDDTVISVATPAPLAEAADPIPFPDIWRHTLVTYVRARANGMETDELEAGAQGRAVMLMAEFDKLVATT